MKFCKLETSIWRCSLVPKGRGESAAGELLAESQLSRTHAGHATRTQAAGSFLFAKWSVPQLSAGQASRSLQREGGSGSPHGSLTRHDGLL